MSATAFAWLVVAMVGQAVFLAYVLGFYGRAVWDGEPARWNKVLPHGYVPGDMVGNAVVASHLLLTVVALLGGALQLWPGLRRAAPRVHHWVGRTYLLAVLVLSVGGLVMVWSGKAVGGLGQHLGISGNALLIVLFALLAWRTARARCFDAHRRWALRLYLAVLGVWFFRVGLMLWIVANQGPVGFDMDTFQGPFLVFLNVAQYLLPLAVLELYLRAQLSTRPPFAWAMAGCLGVLTLLTAAGVAAASMIMWLPRL